MTENPMLKDGHDLHSGPAVNNYVHEDYQRRRNFLRLLLCHIGFRFLAKIDRVEGFENIPRSGATIVMINHIAFIDPIAVLNVYPRNLTPMAKKEVYTYPLIGVIPKIWGVVPVEREGFDRQAVRKAEKILQAGEVILIAPEGTRSPALQEGKEGVAFLAARTGALVLPVAIDGTEGFPTHPFSSRWQQPGAVIKFGKPFTYQGVSDRPGRAELHQMTDEAMILLARMLPEHRRGVYAERINHKLVTVQFHHK